MAKVVYRAKTKEMAEKQLEMFIKPADPNARLEQDEDGWWIIIADAILGSEPVRVQK